MKDEEEISRMLASLKTVDAPEDFEGGVRSRIAKRREEPSLSRPSLLLVAKFALPLLVLVAIGGFLMVSNNRVLNADMVPPVIEETQVLAVIDDPETATSMPINSSPPIAQVQANRGGRNSSAVPQGGSQDKGLPSDDSRVFPDGVDPRKAKVTNGKAPSGGQISLTSVLSTIGISASCSSTGCIATDVREGSVAANSGIRTGDQLVALDQRPINSSTAFTGGMSVSSITLVRDGKRIVVWIGRR